MRLSAPLLANWHGHSTAKRLRAGLKAAQVRGMNFAGKHIDDGLDAFVKEGSHCRRKPEELTIVKVLSAYFSPSWTAFQAERGRDFRLIVDGISN